MESLHSLLHHSPHPIPTSSYEIHFNSTTILLKAGATKDVVEGRSDLVINTRPFTPLYMIEYLYPHYFNPVSIIVPKARRITWSTSVFSAFKVNAMLPILITSLIVLLINTLLHRMRGSNNRHVSPALEIISHFLLSSYTSTVRYRSSHRSMLITWSFFSIVIMSVMTGAMYSHLVVVRYGSDIDTVDQLMKTPYRIPITRQRYSLFEIYQNKASNETTAPKPIMLSDQYWRLMPKFIVSESQKDTFELIEHNQQFAFMQTNGHCEYFVSKKRFQGPDNGPVYHLMKEVVGKAELSPFGACISQVVVF